jgi:BirA family biotin operon repressor/biotin-[acetyl-CoA-carboxylase] ligase
LAAGTPAHRWPADSVIPGNDMSRGIPMEELTPEAIRRDLGTEFLGQHVLCYDRVGSTNTISKELAEGGAPEGTLVVAEEQTTGRGRRGRRWLAPAGSSLLVSLILRPSLAPEELPLLLMASALAVARAIEESTGLAVHFKWPNDILLGDKKAGGILIETGLSGQDVEYAVIGIGLNVNLDVASIPEIAPTATSISAALGEETSRVQILQSLLRSMEKEYLLLQRGHTPIARWAARLSRLGQQVQVDTPWGRETGQLEGVDPDGTLILRRGDGTEARITVGDVT